MYLASASNGNRGVLKLVGEFLAQEHYVFAPCLLGFGGFSLGNEPEDVRSLVLSRDLKILDLLDTFVILWEGIESEGIWSELERANELAMPSAILRMSDAMMPDRGTAVLLNDLHDVKGWLNEL